MSRSIHHRRGWGAVLPSMKSHLTTQVTRLKKPYDILGHRTATSTYLFKRNNQECVQNFITETLKTENYVTVKNFLKTNYTEKYTNVLSLK